MIHKPVVWRMGDATQPNGIFIVQQDFKRLSRIQMHLLPYRIREGYLAFLGEHGSHGRDNLPRRTSFCNVAFWPTTETPSSASCAMPYFPEFTEPPPR